MKPLGSSGAFSTVLDRYVPQGLLPLKGTFARAALAIVWVVVVAGRAWPQGEGPGNVIAPTVVVELGKPNVWTMEQAHYLLEKNRAHDLSLAAQDLGPLDANEIVGYRLEALKTLFAAQIQYDATAGAKNRATASQYKVDIAHYNALRNQQDQLRARQAAFATELAAAQYKLSVLQAETPSDAAKIQLQQAEVARITAEKAGVDSELNSVTSAMGAEPALSSLTSSVPTTDALSGSAVGTNPVFTQMLQGLPPGLNNSKIQASIKLDNYINLQYEIVAKQLTLLRDEAGPRNRVIFLELPQSVYVTQKFKYFLPDFPALLGAHLVQSWWKIQEVLVAEPLEADEDGRPLRPPDREELRAVLEQQRVNEGTGPVNAKPGATEKCRPAHIALAAFLYADDECGKLYWDTAAAANLRQQQAPPKRRADAGGKPKPQPNTQQPSGTQLGLFRLAASPLLIDPAASCTSGDARETAHDDSRKDQGQICDWATKWKFALLRDGHVPLADAPTDQAKPLELANLLEPEATRPAYALDLIPRQSALNVADAHSSSHAYGFAGLFGFLTGLGGKARYEQQRDRYSQFAQQEAYASAFGKGQEIFGWTFGPLPGTKRMAPGLRTTYAVLVVPKNARFIRLQGYGCGYRRRTVPKNPFLYDDADKSVDECGKPIIYDIEIPSGDDDFDIEKIYYKPQPAGQRSTVELEGQFSPQIGILVNGTPLQKVVSIAQPMLERPDFKFPSNAGDPGVQGVYEAIGTKRLIMSFVMPAGFSGTPQIALVTPSREAVINAFDLDIHDGTDRHHHDDRTVHHRQELRASAPMFYPPLSIAKLTPDYSQATDQLAAPEKPSVLIQLFGQGFDPTSNNALLVNGRVMKRQEPFDSHKELALDEYRIVRSGIMQVRIDRKKNYPHWQVNFLEDDGNQSQQAAFAYDDDGPPDYPTCTMQTKTEDKTSVLSIVLKGSFFSSGYAPTASNDNIKLTSAVLVSPNEWDITATPVKQVPEGIITLKGPLNSPQFSLSSCKSPQTEKPKATVVARKSQASGMETRAAARK